MRSFWLPGVVCTALLVPAPLVQAQSIDDLFRQGNAAQAAGDYATAESIWRQVLRQDPDNAAAHFYLGNALYNQGRLEDAEAAYRESLSIQLNAFTYTNLGNVLRNQGRLEDAEAAYREALRLDPDDAFAYHNLGAALYDQGRYEEAEEASRAGISLNPADPHIHYNGLGNALADQGRYEEAEEAFREAIRLDPEYAMVYNNLGNALADQGRYEEAEEAFREAIRLDPDNANAYNGLGAALSEQGRYEEAEEAFREAIRLDPDNALAYHNLGAALWSQWRLEEAEAASREAIRLDPDYANAYNGLGAALSEQGRYEEAEEASREAIRLDPDDANAYHNLGIALSEQGRYEDAEAAYRESLRLAPDDANAYHNLGYLYQVQERYAEAIDLYEQALAINPDNTTAQDNLAEAQRLLNLQTNPAPTRTDDIAWLPDNEPLLPVLRAVVRVVTTTTTGIEYGTGVVVRREGTRIWVVTNRHVVTDGLPGAGAVDERRAQRQAAPLSEAVAVDFYSEPPANRTWLRLDAEVVEATGPRDELDLALLVIDNAPDDVQPLELLPTAAGLDTDVRLIGHHNAPWGLSRGYISQRPEGTVLQLAGAAIGRRSSGSPILDAENRVVGIVTSIEPPNIGQGGDFLGGFSYGHPSPAVLQVLNLWGMN